MTDHKYKTDQISGHVPSSLFAGHTKRLYVWNYMKYPVQCKQFPEQDGAKLSDYSSRWGYLETQLDELYRSYSGSLLTLLVICNLSWSTLPTYFITRSRYSKYQVYCKRYSNYEKPMAVVVRWKLQESLHFTTNIKPFIDSSSWQTD